MAEIYADDIADVQETTLDTLGRGFWSQIAQTLQEYHALDWFMDSGWRDEEPDGHEIRFNTVLTSSNPAKAAGFTTPMGNNIPSLATHGTVPWRHFNTYFATVYQTDYRMNSGTSRIVSMIAQRTFDAWLSLAKLLEDQFFGTSLTLANETDLYGIKYWIVQNATAGFNGGLPSDHTAVGGLSPTTYTRWKNYTGDYVSITDRNFIPIVRTLLRKIGFKPPKPSEGMKMFGKNMIIYTNESGISGAEALLDKRNDNPGSEMVKFHNATTLRGNPVVWVPKLDDDTNDPFYFVNRKVIKPVVLKGDVMRRVTQKEFTDQVNVARTSWFLTGNIKCEDRRSLAVIQKA